MRHAASEAVARAVVARAVVAAVATRAAAVLAVATLVAAGCSHPNPGVPLELHVGVHHVRVVAPQGWQTIDLGKSKILQGDGVQLEIQDLGPAGALGVRREVERARDLWRSGREADAQWRLRTVPVRDDLFATAEERQSFWAAWSLVSGAPPGTPFGQVESAFDEILARTDAMKSGDLTSVSSVALAAWNEDERREVGGRQPLKIDGHDALMVETWLRLTHGDPRRYAFIMNDGYVLGLRTRAGPLRAVWEALETVARSISFPDAAPGA